MSYIKVRVTPDSSAERIVQDGPDSFEVSVAARAKGGVANRRVLELLRKHFKDAKRIYIVNGHHSPHKIISID